MRKCISSGSLHSVLTDSRDHRKRGGVDRCCKTDTRANVGLEQPIASDSPFASHPSNKVPERKSHSAKDSGVVGFRRQDSAHEGSNSPLPWNLHSSRRLEKTRTPCRDSASSFDRTAEALDDKRRSSLEAGSASDGNMSQQSDGSQCDLKAYTSVRRSQPRQPPPRAASLPDCLWYLPMQRSQQQQEQQQQPDQQHDLTSQRRSFSSDEGSDMDADCCGDSGAISIKSGAESRLALTARNGPFPVSTRAYSLDCVPVQRTRISFSDDDEDGAETACTGMRELNRWHSSSCLSEGQAAVELFFRLNHARQTVDYVRRQAAMYARLDRAQMGIWEALELLGTLREYETVLMDEEGTDADLSLPEHAAMTAEACRAAFPDLDWLHLVGLIHSLGKLLAHKRIRGEPQWAVCGESFPVGCCFHPSIVCSAFFSVNPDRRRRIYNTPTGIYREGCGLAAVHMSWSASEYLYMVLLLNKTKLPAEALFLLRHQRFNALNRPGAPYDELLSGSDRLMVPWLARFKELSAYKRKPAPPGGRLTGDAFRAYYSGLIAKYIPQGILRW